MAMQFVRMCIILSSFCCKTIEPKRSTERKVMPVFTEGNLSYGFVKAQLGRNNCGD
jgi:hypothetical protein